MCVTFSVTLPPTRVPPVSRIRLLGLSECDRSEVENLRVTGDQTGFLPSIAFSLEMAEDYEHARPLANCFIRVTVLLRK